MLARSVTSRAMACACPPAARIASATASTRARSRAAGKTNEPSRPRVSAISRPIPREAPVTSDTRPSSDPTRLLLHPGLTGVTLSLASHHGRPPRSSRRGRCRGLAPTEGMQFRLDLLVETAPEEGLGRTYSMLDCPGV